MALAHHIPPGMAANYPQDPTPPRAPRDPLSSTEIAARLEEEVSRAARHRTPLSCLIVSLDGVDELATAHGDSMPAQALAYLADAVGRQLRCFDRVGHASQGELLVLLPGTDEQRGEIVARRTLSRLHSIKIEAEGHRRPLRVSMGICAWREGLTGEQLLFHTRLAAQRHNYLQPHADAPSESPSTGATGMRPPLPS
ncbi:MAG: GGDEF domain-containing protein [Solirubrobacteraceae bacterium]